MNFLRAISRWFLICSLAASLLLFLRASIPRVAASGAVSVVGYSLPIGSSFRGDNFQTAPAPRPDVNIAASPVKILEMTNFDYEIFSKSGSPAVGPFAIMNTVFGEPNLPSYHISDPVLVFDSLSGKWFAAISTCIDDASGKCARWQLDVAFQNQAYEAFPWYAYHFLSPYTAIDRPFMAVTGDKVIAVASVSLDASSPYCNGYSCTQLEYWVINKSQMLNLASSVDSVTGILTCSNSALCPSAPSLGVIANVAPVQILSSSNTGYMVGLIVGSSPMKVDSISVSGLPATGITFQSNTITVSTVGLTVGQAIQPSSVSIRTDPGFIFTGVWYQGNLWLDTESSCTPLGDSSARSCIRLIQIDTTLNAKKQDFDFNQTGTYLFRPALSLDGFGDMVLTYGYSSSTIYPSVAAAALPSLSQNSISLLKPVKTGTAVAPPDGSNNPQRYGDYFSAAVDPADSSTVWVAGEYPDASLGTCVYGGFGTGSCWSTWIASVRVVGLSLSSPISAFNVGSGQAASIVVQATARAALSGTVTLSASVTPSGPTPSVSPASIQLTLGGSNQATATVTASGVPVGGTYTLLVTGQTPDLSLTLPISVTVVTPLVCSAGASPTSARNQVTVQFSASCPSGTSPYSYSWSFNDGTGATSTLQNPAYTYYYQPNPNRGSNYYPTLTISDANGLVSLPPVPSIIVTCGTPCYTSPPP